MSCANTWVITQIVAFSILAPETRREPPLRVRVDLSVNTSSPHPNRHSTHNLEEPKTYKPLTPPPVLIRDDGNIMRQDGGSSWNVDTSSSRNDSGYDSPCVKPNVVDEIPNESEPGGYGDDCGSDGRREV